MRKWTIYQISIALLGCMTVSTFFYYDFMDDAAARALENDLSLPWFELFEALLMTLPLSVLIYMLFGHAERTRGAKLKMREMELAHAETEQFLILGRLAASIAHEVRNPLNNILLLLDELNRLSGENEEVNDVGARIKRNAGRINHAVELVYRLARPVDIKHRLESNDYGDLIVLFDAIVVDFKNNDAQVVVTNKTGRKKVMMSGDYDCLQTVFENLLRNAVIASRNTPVYVDLEDVLETGAVRVVIYNEGQLPESFKISTIDELSNDRGKVHGLGLGVIIVNELAKQMHMRISYHSDGKVVSFEVIGSSHRGIFDPVNGIDDKEEMNDGSVPRIDS